MSGLVIVRCVVYCVVVSRLWTSFGGGCSCDANCVPVSVLLMKVYAGKAYVRPCVLLCVSRHASYSKPFRCFALAPVNIGIFYFCQESVVEVDVEVYLPLTIQVYRDDLVCGWVSKISCAGIAVCLFYFVCSIPPRSACFSSELRIACVGGPCSL